MRKSTAPLVERILSDNRISTIMNVSPRDSDKALIVQFLQMSGCNLTAEQIGVIRGVSFETITRVRRKLQEGGEYLGDKAIAAERKRKAEEVRVMAVKASPAELEAVL